MNPLRTYDYLALARQRVLDWARPLSGEQYSRPFEIGLGSLARILTHTMASEWYYVQRLLARTVPPQAEWPIRDEAPPPFPALEAAWIDQAALTRAALDQPRDWNADLEYEIVDDDGRNVLITASAADIFTQLALHEVHHRAQAMNILRRLGVQAEDIDFNALMYRRRPA